MSKEQEALIEAQSNLNVAYARQDEAQIAWAEANAAVKIAEAREQEARFALRALSTPERQD